MPCHLYSIRDAPKQESFRAQLREFGMEIVRWEAPLPGEAVAGGTIPPDFLVYTGRDQIMFALCSTPHTEAAAIDSRVREDRITIRAGLITRGDRTWQVGRDRVELKGMDVTLVYQEKGKIIRGSGAAPERSISLMIKPSVLRAKLGDRLAQFPQPVRDVIMGKRPFPAERRVSGGLMSVMSRLADLLRPSPPCPELPAQAPSPAALPAARPSAPRRASGYRPSRGPADRPTRPARRDRARVRP